MALPEEERKTLPKLIVGAEVAWVPNLAGWSDLEQLCIGKSRTLLLELPFTPWNEIMFHQLYDLMGRTGITPMIAHIERYRKIQKKEHIEEILSLGLPVQVSAEPLLGLLSRGRELKLLRERRVQYIVSDCHNTTSRPPNLGKAMAVLRDKLGDGKADSMERRTDDLAVNSFQQAGA